MGKIRSSKFERRSQSKALTIRQRHVDVLDMVYKYRYLTIEQIAILLGRKAPSTKNLVRSLYDHGYLLRPLCQRDPAPWHTSEIYHMISNKGAEVLRQRKGYIVPHNDYDALEKKSSIRNWTHDTTMSDFLVKLQADVNQNPEIELSMTWDLVERGEIPEETPWKPQNWDFLTWTFNDGGKTRKLIPDEVLMFRKGGKRQLMFLEIDMGTEPVRRNGKGSSIVEKMEKYTEVYRRGLHTEKYGMQKMRVLLVTTSKQRVNEISEITESNIAVLQYRCSTISLFNKKAT